MSAGMHKILKIISETRVDGISIDYNMDPLQTIKKAEKDNNLNKYKKDIYFCVYNTIYESVDSVILTFMLLLPGSPNGSSASSEIVMKLVESIEKLLYPVDSIEFTKDIDGSRKNICALTVIKKSIETSLP